MPRNATPKPIIAIARLIRRTPPEASCSRAAPNRDSTPINSSAACAVSRGLMLSDCHAAAFGTRLKEERTSAACGDNRLPITAGNGMSCSTTAPTSSARLQSSGCIGRGMATAAYPRLKMANITAIVGLRPPNATSGSSSSVVSARTRNVWRESGRRGGVAVVALVVIAVIARVVVIVTLEVNAIQHAAERSRPPRH